MSVEVIAPDTNEAAHALPSLAWQDNWPGSSRAPFAGGHFLVIPSGINWIARFERNGRTEWLQAVPFDTAEQAQEQCEKRCVELDRGADT